MSKQLLDRAEQIRLSSPEECAVELLKQAGMDEKAARVEIAQLEMEKIAAQEIVSSSGVDIEQAVALVKAANMNIKDLTGFNVAQDPTIGLLKSAATYIEQLEAERDELVKSMEKAAEDLRIQEVTLPEPITKAASSGMFTNEDLEMLRSMDQELLTKVASVSDEPWSMGRGIGVARTKTDPLAEFILSDLQ